MRLFVAFLCVSSMLFGAVDHVEESDEPVHLDPHVKSPEEIQKELDSAQRDYDLAEKMFIPWYTGPLITGSASNVAPGHVNVAVPVFFVINHAAYNGNRKSVNTPNTFTINPQLYIQPGITSWLDVALGVQGDFAWNSSTSSQEFGDMSVAFGLQLLKGSPHAPSVRLILTEIFPTGRYKNLGGSKANIAASGGGIYNTTIGLNINKLFWWAATHPINVRLGTNYSFPNNRADVSGFHAYGGGNNTSGKVTVGHVWNLDVGIEVSLTQKWVLANDFVYSYQTKSAFDGIAGTSPTGAIAINGSPSSDQFSIAPAVEYNVSSNGGLIVGVWFTITGRNSTNFATPIVSYSQYF